MTEQTARPSRRTILVATGSVVLPPSVPSRSVVERLPGANDRHLCFVMPESVDEPFCGSQAIDRRNISGNQLGIPLSVRVRIVDPPSSPVAPTHVDFWHANARGICSNFLSRCDESIMRYAWPDLSSQNTHDRRKEWVTSDSIYPSGCCARTVHIHFKICRGGRTCLKTQMFYSDAPNELIYRNAPEYLRRTMREPVTMTDWIQIAATHHTMGNLRKKVDRYAAEIAYEVKFAAMLLLFKKTQSLKEELCVPQQNAPRNIADQIASLVPSRAKLKQRALLKSRAPQ